eukprot:CAMPEP_0171354966 /NCGR_PEP_ID=MMETSP0878-20121228/44979_1 /TAXON_ID=67004 /ORGANISM="Thalassiosira weissflogii, Strain CCMP1336" /LENGTH=542 /DNA_ID=CAMNT_0011860957 /DNA_START=19 /DNA_END=1644 /DNA_ORIENTATION=-
MTRQTEPTRRPKPKGDVYARCRTGSTAGRGVIAGWTPCPLCIQPKNTTSTLLVSLLADDSTISGNTQSLLNFTDANILEILSTCQNSKKSTKLFTHGRGLAAHLHAVHTPWNPGKAELKRRKALQRRAENELRRQECQDNKAMSSSNEDDKRSTKRLKISHGDSEYINNEVSDNIWIPTDEDIKNWNQRVMEIVSLIESEAKKTKIKGKDVIKYASNNEQLSSALGHNSVNTTDGRDRAGKTCLSYRDSLHPFLAAAADGDIEILRGCVNNHREINSTEGTQSNTLEHAKVLLSLRDRNGSSAEHWAAGGGHIDCLLFLLQLRDTAFAASLEEPSVHADQRQNTQSQTISSACKKIRRRRDGKTSLHYASRNGHNNCIDLLLSRPDAPPVDVPSGDGTTPLHMACYGGHISTVKHLIEKYGANVHAVNEWQCGSGHWAAMSLGDSGPDAMIELCNYLKLECQVDFVARQKQGHTPLHKAASRKNRRVIEWMAGKETFSKDRNLRLPLFSEHEKATMGMVDEGGNCPSDIWLSVGGDKEFGEW